MATDVEIGIDTAKALKLRLQGLSFAEIGRIAGGLSAQAIEQRLARFKRIVDNPDSIHAYRDNEAELLDGIRAQLITTLVDDISRKGKKALSGYQKVGMYGILFDKMRLLRNESTANVSNLTAIIQAATARTVPNSKADREIDVTPKPEND